MTIDQWLSASLDVISLLGFVVVIIQLRDSNQQTKLESQIRLYDINRELIAMGLADPELFKVLEDFEKVDGTKERRYLQLWLNQLCLIDSFRRRGAFEADVRDSFEIDFRDMMLKANMQRHWSRFKKYYPASFQKSVNDIFIEAGQNKAGESGESFTS